VVLVAQDGYVLYDRVVRPAQVIVSVAPGGES
jgi:molecular chaperone GrpE (heat shock protein)